MITAMTKDQPQGPDQAHFHRMAEWAENEMEIDPASTTARRGADAVAHARAMFEAAGLDTAALDSAIGGRPRLDPGAARGTHSPKLNFRVPETVSQALNDQANSRGLTTSALARRIIEDWLSAQTTRNGQQA